MQEMITIPKEKLNALQESLNNREKEIIERKRTEEALRESELKYRNLVEQAGDGFELLDSTGKYVDVNESTCRMLGYSRGEMLRLSIPDIDPLKDHSQFVADFNSLIENRHATFETIHRRKDGTEFPVEITSQIIKIKDNYFSQGFSRDITRRRRAERILRTSEELHRSILKTAMDGLLIVDMQGRILQVNDAYCIMCGYSEQQLLTMNISDLKASDFLAETASRIQRIASEGTDRFESAHRRKDGSTFDVEISTQFLSIEGGRIVGFIRDISTRKKAEETLKASENKYRRLHQSMMDGYVSVDMNGKIEDFNEPYRLMLGYGPDELRELTFWDVTPERWHAWQDSVIREQVFNRGYSDVYEKEYRKKDGTIFPVEIRTSLLKDDLGNNIGMWAIVRDVTERTLAQKEKDKLYRERIEEKQRHLTERERLLMDLHDGVGGLVTNIRLLADLSRKTTEKENINKTLATISELSQEAISEIRGLMQSLDSSELNWEALTATLRNEGAAMIEAHGMSFTAEAEVGASGQPGSLLWVNLFRIYKEALTNIIKHSHAKSVTVTLRNTDDKLTLDVWDDGVGWSGHAKSGRGLAIMQKRAKDLGGAVTVTTGSAGTRVSLAVLLSLGKSPATFEQRQEGEEGFF
jgi:PAS domain S-box-containing protein